MAYSFLELLNVPGAPHNSVLVSHVIADAARQVAENIALFIKSEKVMGIVRREDYLY